MIGPHGCTRVFAYPRPCDMRKSYYTLSGLVASLGHDVTKGDVFAFVSKDRKSTKVLWYDGTGLRLLSKRLDSGRFAALWREDGGEVSLTLSELSLLLDGCTVVGRIELGPKVQAPEEKSRISLSSFR